MKKMRTHWTMEKHSCLGGDLTWSSRLKVSYSFWAWKSSYNWSFSKCLNISSLSLQQYFCSHHKVFIYFNQFCNSTVKQEISLQRSLSMRPVMLRLTKLLAALQLFTPMASSLPQALKMLLSRLVHTNLVE